MSAEYLQVRTCSLILDGVAENTIRAAITTGELPAARFGRSIRVAKADLESWFESKKGAAA